MKHLLNNSNASALILATDGFLRLNISGFSMEPIIQNNEQITVTTFKKLKRGVCYLFSYRSRLLVHRLVAVTSMEAIFMGDNSNSIERVPTDAVIGMVTTEKPFVGRMALAILNNSCYIVYSVFRPRHGVYSLVHAVRKKCIRCIYAAVNCFDKYSPGKPRLGRNYT